MNLAILIILYSLSTLAENSDYNPYDELLRNEQSKKEPLESIRYAYNVHKQPYGIIIEGEIKNGAYEEFERLIKNAKGEIETVLLRSPGGNALEAIKMGRLIRKLKLGTEAPDGSPEKPYCLFPRDLKTENCTCASACFLVYAAGVRRSGDVLGIHRIYQDHEQLSKLTLETSAKNANEIKKSVESYLTEMGVPNSIREKIFQVSSKQIVFLNTDELKSKLNGFISEVEEWFIAKCGDSETINETRMKLVDVWYAGNKKSKTIENKIKILSDKQDEIEACVRKETDSERHRVFKTVF